MEQAFNAKKGTEENIQYEARRPKLLYVGTLPCEPTFGGPIQIHRHFVESGDYDFQSILEPKGTATAYLTTRVRPLNRLLERLTNTCLFPEILAANFLGAGREASKVVALAKAHDADAIVTVAYGAYAFAAASVARLLHLPLITFFHDWWPDLIPCRGLGKRLLDCQFRRVYRESAVALCVSEEIRNELGDHANAPVLYPIPAFHRPRLDQTVQLSGSQRPFRLVYLGTLQGRYGAMAQSLVTELAQTSNKMIDLKLYGPADDWPGNLLAIAESAGIYGGPRYRQQAEAALSDADGFLILMNFDSSDCRRVRTSFPSKLLEYCAYGKPIVGWAPEYSSLVRFLRENQCGHVVTSPSPQAAIAAFESLGKDSFRCASYGQAARRLSDTVFDPKVIHTELCGHIAAALRNYRDC